MIQHAYGLWSVQISFITNALRSIHKFVWSEERTGRNGARALERSGRAQSQAARAVESANRAPPLAEEA